MSNSIRIGSILLLALCVAVDGWGKLGHEIVANLAWKLLTNQTRSSLTKILEANHTNYDAMLQLRSPQDDPTCPDCSPIGMIADWADQIRRYWKYHWSGPLHYVDVRDDSIPGGCPAQSPEERKKSEQPCVFDYSRDCADDVCVVGAIVNYTQRIMVANLTIPQDPSNATIVRESLMFLVHFVGDIHQPLHVSRLTDIGGNEIFVHFNQSFQTPNNFHLRHRMARRIKQQVQLKHSPRNLHAVWDDGIINKYLNQDFEGSRKQAEESLYANIVHEATGDTDRWKEWLACSTGSKVSCPTAWAKESLDYALTWAYRDVRGSEVSNGTTLSEAYYETRLPIVKERLTGAAVRLASTLAMALAGCMRLEIGQSITHAEYGILQQF